MKIETLTTFEQVKHIVDSLKKNLNRNHTLDIDKVLDVVIKDLQEKFGLKNINIFLLDKPREKLLPYRLFNPQLSPSLVDKLSQLPIILANEPGMLLYIFEKKISIYIPEMKPEMVLSPWGKEVFEITGMQGNLMFPLVIEEMVCGLITFPSFDIPLNLTKKQIEEIANYVFYISIALTSMFYSIELQEKNKIIQEKNRQLRNDLNLAKSIQQALIPLKTPNIEGICLASLYKPMEAIGGDFYDFIRVREPDLLGIFISDVSGHGVSAALITTMVKTLLETAGINRINPSHLLKYINETIAGQTGGNFLTAFYGVYDKKTKVFSYAKGAHNPPYLIRDNTLTLLESKGKILALLEGLEFEEKQIQLQKGDRILFYTDGLTEAENDQGLEFEEVLHKILVQNFKGKAQDFLDFIYHALLEHRGGYHFDDDVCIVVMDIL